MEDDAGIIELTSYFLNRMGGKDFKIDSVLSAEEALDKVSKENFDAIISDYKMPGMDGIELLEALRKAGNETPFIIFTGKGEERVAMDALNKGANRYIVKSANLALPCGELANSIREIVEKRKIRELLEEVKNRYNKGLVEGIVELPWEMDTLARFTFCGPQIEEKIGYKPEDVFNCTLFEFLPPDDAKEEQRIRTLLEDLTREPKRIANIPIKLLHKNGSIRKQETSIAPIFNKASRLVGFRGIMRDVNMRKRHKIMIWRKGKV